MELVRLTIELYLVIVAVDVFLGWIQPESGRRPRRWTHRLTEPLQVPLRGLVRPEWTGGLDISPLIVVAICGLLRMGVLSWL